MLAKRETASWVIPLAGDHFDLEDLPLWLAGQGVHVAERDGAFELVIPVATIGDNYEPVRAFAEEQLDLINGVGRLLGQGFRPLSLADKLFGIDAAGTVVHTVLAVGTAEMRVKAGSVRVVVGGKVQPDPREAAVCPSSGPSFTLSSCARCPHYRRSPSFDLVRALSPFRTRSS